MHARDKPGSSLKFGTSGLRGLVTDLVGAPTRAWANAFLTHLETKASTGRLLLVGRDLRASSPSIVSDCLEVAAQRGWHTADCGALPTPALALAALEHKAAAIMVTGSHIPDDRNGLKFYAPGEITKQDETSIRLQFEKSRLPEMIDRGRTVEVRAMEAYRNRYLSVFAHDALSGLTVGVYQQSSVARDLLVEVLEGLGANAVPLARARDFIPVDTEAHRPEDLSLLREWAIEGHFDAFVSTDGDADRPLVADAKGEVLRGDILGLLTASVVGLRTIVTPVTSSSSIEKSGVAETVLRTKVGSPYVIEAMDRAVASGKKDVLGFEANGGALLGSDIVLPGGILSALPTRDAMLPILCALLAVRSHGRLLRAIAEGFSAGYALSDRLKDISADQSAPFLMRLAQDGDFTAQFMSEAGTIVGKDDLDGQRFILDDGSVVHFRASGNAPELRAYVEAPTLVRAENLLKWSLNAAQETMGISKTVHQAAA